MLRLITKHREYQEFASPLRHLRSPHFHVMVLSSVNEFAVGITISNRIGKAHLRNLLKRRIKSWLHLHRNELQAGFKLNLIAKKGAGELSWQELNSELETLLGTFSAGR